MDVGPSARISKTRFRWLRAQAERWSADGLIDSQAKDRILASYDLESSERQGMLAVVLLAVLMCSVGLLLLFGYNWDLIPRGLKVALLVGMVAAAFGSSAITYAKGHAVAGETLAFAGTLLFGVALFMVAEVLHIAGHVPDAFLWFGIGVLVSAWLIRSQWIGIGAGVLVLVWTVAQSAMTAGPAFGFLALWPAALLVAYRLDSPVVLFLVAVEVGVWVFFGAVDHSRSPVWLGSVALTACALYSLGRAHVRNEGLRSAWQGAGFVLLLLILIPLMVSEVHRTRDGDAAALSIVVAAVAAMITMGGLARPSRVAVDKAIIAFGASVVVWIALGWSGAVGQGAAWTRISTVLFSVLALAVAVSFIRDALGSGSLVDLSAGVLFAVAFLVVRWASVIENLLWSGVLLLAAGGGLLLLARLWRRRPGAAAAAGRLS